MLLLVAGCPATGKTTFVHENWPNDSVIEFDEWVTLYYGLPFVAAMDKYVAEFPESQHKYFNDIGKLYTQKKRLIVCDTFTYRKDRLDFLRYMDEKFNIPPNEIKIDYLVAKYKTIKERNEEIELYLGNEIYFSDNIISLLEEGKATTINNTSYLLFELPLNAKPFNIYNIIYELLEYKLIPVLAHPERYTFVQSEPELVYDLIQKGVLMQCNYGSIIGQYGKKAQIIVKKLYENNMVHFLGTDVHKQNTIYERIPEILPQISEIIGEEKLEEITTLNAQKVLENKRIDIDEPKQIKLSLKEKIILK